MQKLPEKQAISITARSPRDCVTVVVRWYRSGQVLPYDNEVATARRPRRRSKTKKKVIQTQTSPARQQPQPPTGTLLSQQSHAPAVFVTDATPLPSSRSTTSVPGTVDDDHSWAKPYPDETTSVSETRTRRKKLVTVERVSVVETNRAVTPSAVTVTTSPQASKKAPKQDLFSMLPDIEDGSKNTRPG